MEDRARKVEELEREIAQTVEGQVKENGELVLRVRQIEEGVRACIGGYDEGSGIVEAVIDCVA